MAAGFELVAAGDEEGVDVDGGDAELVGLVGVWLVEGEGEQPTNVVVVRINTRLRARAKLQLRTAIIARSG
jgi:hypothetical protein